LFLELQCSRQANGSATDNYNIILHRIGIWDVP
jgi:hypothetical protein